MQRAQSRLLLAVSSSVGAALLWALAPLHAQDGGGGQGWFDTAERLAHTVESLEAGDDPNLAWPTPEQVSAAYSATLAHLATSPDDVSASILLARLGRILRAIEPVVLTPDATPETGAPPVEASIAALNHAIELAPESAEAHYWLARIYGASEPMIVDGRITREPRSLEEAINHARQAVEAAPGELEYREALAIYLVSAQEYVEAIDVFAEGGAGDHLIARILTDFEAVPLPTEAKYLPTASAGLAELMDSRGRFENYPNMRVRMYAAPFEKSLFEDALRRKWPSFGFYETDTEKLGDTRMTMYTQALRRRDDGLKPLSEKEEVTLANTDSDPEGILLLTATEFDNPTSEILEEYGLQDAERVTVLSLIAVRKPEISRIALTPLGEALLGEWDIEDWSYRGDSGRESYSGYLRVTAQTSESEFEGTLFSRNQRGAWGRQRMRISAVGNELEATGQVIAASGTWYPDKLSLTLSDDRLRGRSVDTSGDGGKVEFVKRR